MVLELRDAYWVSKRLHNIASCYIGAIWIANTFKAGTYSFATIDAKQNEYLVVC